MNFLACKKCVEEKETSCAKCTHFSSYKNYICAGWCEKRRKRVQWGNHFGYANFIRFPHCVFFEEMWIPTFTHHKCENLNCKTDKPMTAYSVQWGGKLVSIMFQCDACGRLDGEVWDIAKKKLLTERNYMESRYGEFEDIMRKIES